MMASTVADNVSRPVAPLSANSSRNLLRLRARRPMIASAYTYHPDRAEDDGRTRPAGRHHLFHPLGVPCDAMRRASIVDELMAPVVQAVGEWRKRNAPAKTEDEGDE